MYLPYFQRQKLSETRQKLRGKSMISLGILWGSQMSISRIAAADLQLGNSPSSPVSSSCWHVLCLTVLQLIRVMSYHFISFIFLSYHIISFISYHIIHIISYHSYHFISFISYHIIHIFVISFISCHMISCLIRVSYTSHLDLWSVPGLRCHRDPWDPWDLWDPLRKRPVDPVDPVGPVGLCRVDQVPGPEVTRDPGGHPGGHPGWCVRQRLAVSSCVRSGGCFGVFVVFQLSSSFHLWFLKWLGRLG